MEWSTSFHFLTAHVCLDVLLVSLWTNKYILELFTQYESYFKVSPFIAFEQYRLFLRYESLFYIMVTVKLSNVIGVANKATLCKNCFRVIYSVAND